MSTGHKSGGFNDTFDVNVIPETFSPESIKAYEIGSKMSHRWFGRPGTFNVSAFYYDYTDQVFQDLTVISLNNDGEPAGYSLVNRNIGRSAIYGIEAESVTRFGAGFMLHLNALALDSEIKEGVVGDARSQNYGAGGVTSLIDLTGNELPLASRFTGNVRLQQFSELPFGSLDWQLLASYRSAYYLTQYNNRDVVYVDQAGDFVRQESAAEAGFPDRQRGEVTLNAGIGLTSLDGRWRYELFGSNLLNNDVSQKALVGSRLNIRFLNDARAYGMRVRYQF